MIDSAIIFTVMFIFVRLSAFFIVFNIIFCENASIDNNSFFE